MTQFTRSIIPSQITGHAINPHHSPWSVIVPQEIENLITNPSFEIGTTGWSALGTNPPGFGASTNVSVFGAQSCAVTFAGANSILAVNMVSSASLLAGELLTFSAWVYTSFPRLVYLTYQANFATVASVTSEAAYVANEWQRLKIHVRSSFNSGGTTTFIVFGIASDTNAATAYIDGAQLEISPYVTTYCDGDQDGCFWVGVDHASISKHRASDRRGGRVWNFREFGFDVMDTIGGGAPGVNVIDTPFALIGGGYYQRTTYPIRQFSIVGAFQSRGMIETGRRRAEMWNALRPDIVSPQQPVRLLYDPSACNDFARYGDNPNTIAIDAVYAGGLEGVLANSEIDSVALAFRTHEPGLIGSAIRDNAIDINYQTVLSTAGTFFVRSRETGEILEVVGANKPNNNVYDVINSPSGGVYVAGQFSTPVSGVGHYNYRTDTWTALGSGANATVYTLLIGPDGYLYAGGEFSSIGGVSVTGFARWNGSTWAAIGGSIAGGGQRVRSIVFDAQGRIYIGGSFTSVNGVTANNIAMWDGSAWNAMGGASTRGANAEVLALAFDGGTSIYAAGTFTAVGTILGLDVTAYGIARWDTFQETWNQVGGTGLATSGEDVFDMLIGPNGRLFITGEFGDGMAQDTSATNFAVWNGAWSSLDGGFTDVGYAINLLPDGNLFVTGEFFEDGNPVRAVDYGVVLNGNRWLNADFMPEAPAIRAVGWDNEYEYYGGTGFSVIRGGDVTAVTNANTAVVYPIITLYDATSVVCIKNYTTGDVLYFNLTMISGETAVLRTGLSPTFTSNLRGDILPTIIAPSNPARFRLVPGVNHIYAFVWPATGNTTISMRYRRSYASLDQIV